MGHSGLVSVWVEMMEKMLDFTAQAEKQGNDLALKLIELFGKIAKDNYTC